MKLLHLLLLVLAPMAVPTLGKKIHILMCIRVFQKYTYVSLEVPGSGSPELLIVKHSGLPEGAMVRPRRTECWFQHPSVI